MKKIKKLTVGLNIGKWTKKQANKKKHVYMYKSLFALLTTYEYIYYHHTYAHIYIYIYTKVFQFCILIQMYFLQWNSLLSSSKPCILGIYRNQWLCVLEQEIPESHTWSTDLVVLRNDPRMTVLRHTGYSDENRIDKCVAGLPGFKQSPS